MIRMLPVPFVAACLVTSLAAAAETPPNLVVIMTDDQGYGDTGFNGCKDIPTPNMDAIAANGVRFTDGYVCYSVCSPSRAGFLTGRYPQRFGHERNPQWSPTNRYSGLPLTETTLADALGAAGYRTGLIGKWHLGCHPDLHPNKRGFHEFFGHLGGGHRYFPDELTRKNTTDARDEADSYQTMILRDDAPVKTTRYLTEEFTNEAVRFIERHKAAPFFLFLAYNAPHSPMQAPKETIERFSLITNPKRRTYAAMLSTVDDGVGKVLDALRKYGIEENTMVVFLSDNGGPPADNGSDNGPLRGTKGQPWEGGIRVPFAMQWPKRIPKGLVYQKPVISLDVFATIAAAAGLKTDPQRPLDGVDLLPYLTKQKSSSPHQAIYLRMFDKGAYVVRSGDFKLVIENKDAQPAIYHLGRDIGEETEFTKHFPEQVDILQKLRKEWNSQLIPPAFKGLTQQGAQ